MRQEQDTIQAALLLLRKAASASIDIMSNPADPVSAFIEAACVPLDDSHSSCTLDRAEEILRAHPEVATSNIYTSAILGDHAAVRQFIKLDSASATAKGGPHDW